MITYKNLSLVYFFILFNGFIFANNNNKLVFIEHHSIKNLNGQSEILSFRIPYEKLSFVKLNNEFVANFSLGIEIYQDNKFVMRESSQYSVETDNYEKTISEELFFENKLDFQINPGVYKLFIILTTGSENAQYKLPDTELIVNDLSKKVFNDPIIIEEYKNNNFFTLVNFQHNIIFSPNKNDLLIGVLDSSINKIKYKILQKKNTIIKDSVENIINKNLSFKVFNNKIILTEDSNSTPINFFIIQNFSHLLYEGKAELIITYGNNDSLSFPLNIFWFDKPQVLNNLEYSIKLLNYIEDVKEVNKILQSDQELYYELLFNYWSKKYPANGMKYNYALKEYYSRADYAIKNLSSLNSFDGAESDRGKIYITFGKPSSIDRNYEDKNNILEIWKYDSINRTFIFKDISGTGKFILEK